MSPGTQRSKGSNTNFDVAFPRKLQNNEGKGAPRSTKSVSAESKTRLVEIDKGLVWRDRCIWTSRQPLAHKILTDGPLMELKIALLSGKSVQVLV